MEPKLSVVVCVFNEAPNIRQLVTEISSVLETYEYELIYVDDGSTDATLKILKSIQNDQLTIIEFRKNYGQSSALAAGIELARGDYIVTMDGDLQNDPHDIPEMLLLAEQGQWDLVAGIRVNRKDGTILRKWPSKIANFVIQRSSGVKIADYGCTLRVFKSDIAKDIGLYGQLHRFIPLLAHLEGARITQMPVNHRARTAGTSKYGLNRTIKVASDLLFMLFMKKYLQRPMHVFGNIGVLILFLGIIINGYLLILKILGQDIWGKPLLILAVILTLAGIQLITIGIMAEIQMRTYYESQEKKPYKIRNLHKKGPVAKSPPGSEVKILDLDE